MRARMLLVLALGACGMEAIDGAAPYGDAGGAPGDASFHCFSSNECPSGQTCNEFGVCESPPTMIDGGTSTPPETEYTFGAPISSRRYVYVALTEQDELARIDGLTLAVTATAVGHAPREVRAIPNDDGAAVLDTQTGTIEIVHPGTGVGQPDTTRVLATLPDLNRLDISPDGRFAVVWFDLAKAIADGDLTGVGSFQDITVVALAPGAELAVDLTVGFRPRSVQFDAAGGRAFVVTQDGISVIDLQGATGQGPAIVPPIPVADPAIPPDDLEVHVVSTGDFAAVRQAGASALRVVSLSAADAGAAWSIPLASVPTDIDLAPDGHRVYAVLRDAQKLAVIDVPGDAIDPSGVETIDLTGSLAGSLELSRDGARGLLYTNAVLDEHVTLVQLDAPGYPHATWPLKKSVRAVGLSPTGATAIVLHAKAPGDPATASSVDEYIDESYGYSLLDLASGFAKLQIAPVDPGAFAYAPDGAKAYVALDGGDALTATRALQVVDAHTGVVTTKPLGSGPTAVGVLPGASEAFVAQRHPHGRVSFVNLATDAVRTVTGFDLNSNVVE